MRRRSAFVRGAILRAAAAVAAAVVNTGAAGAEPATVEIVRFAFAPQEITVKPGSTVVWVNRDETPHAVSARGNAFTSKALDTGDRYEYTFAQPGDYAYVCTLHPFMTGIVHVRP